MSHLTQWLMLYLINSAWQLPALLLCSAVVIRLLPWVGSKLQYRLWVVNLFLAVMLPALSASWGPLKNTLVHEPAQRVAQARKTSAAKSTDDGPLTMHFTEIAVSDGRLASGKILLCLYLFSLLAGATKLAMGLKRTGKLVKTSSQVDLDSTMADLLSRSARALGIQPVVVYSCDSLLSPATVSWPKPMLLVPPAFESASAEEAATVIAHELAHISRGDFEMNLVFEVLGVFVFYHPASHWIKRQIAEAREMICDELAADSTKGRRAYAQSLLNIAETALRKPQPAAFSLGILETTNLEKRIMKLVNARLPLSKQHNMLLTVGCWTSLAVCSVGLVLFSLHPATVRAAHAPTFLYDPSETPDVLTPVASRKTAPGFTLTDAEGKPITLSDYKGKVVLLDFWATWCGGCKLEIPWYIEFDKKYRKQGLAVIGVSMDDQGWKVVKPFLAKKKDDETGGMIAMDYPIVIGSDALAQRYGLTSMPMTLLIDKDGKIAVSHTGVVDKVDFESHIQMLLK